MWTSREIRPLFKTRSMSSISMTSGSPVRHILQFALPLILGYILQQVYLITDAAIVGRFLGVNELAAVGASSSIMFLIMGFCNGSCAGFAIPVSQAFGAQDFQRMRRYVWNALFLAAIITLVLTLVCSLLCSWILHRVSTPAEIFHEAWLFLLIQFLSIPFTIAYNLLGSIIRALGNSKTPFLILIISSLYNAVLAFVLIVVLKMGVEGSALATMVSQALSAYWCYTYIRRKMQLLIPQREDRHYDASLSRNLLWQGVPMGLQFSITAIGSIMVQTANNALGTVCVAAFTASLRVKYLFTCVFENLGVAMATYCGQNLGAGKIGRIGQGLRSATSIMLIYMIFTVVVLHFFSDELTLLFVDGNESEIVSNSVIYLQLTSYFFPCLGMLTILRYSIQGLGYSNLSILSGVMEMIARAGVSLWLIPAIGWLGVCWGDPVAWVFADLFLIPCMYFLYRHIKRKERPTPSGPTPAPPYRAGSR